jgi:hypothetical protein
MADKTKTAKVNGLNQLFRISKNGDKRKDTLQLVSDFSEIGGVSVLSKINIDEVIDKIASSYYKYSEDFELEFEEGIQFLAKNYESDTKINFPISQYINTRILSIERIALSFEEEIISCTCCINSFFNCIS